MKGVIFQNLWHGHASEDLHVQTAEAKTLPLVRTLRVSELNEAQKKSIADFLKLADAMAAALAADPDGRKKHGQSVFRRGDVRVWQGDPPVIVNHPQSSNFPLSNHELS